MLTSKHVPFYYHPSTLVLVDDQATYLRSMLTAVEHVADSLGFTNPEEALTFIVQQNPEHLVLGNGEEALIKPENLAAYLANGERFKTVTTVVVDYNMPSMTGLDFCRRIQSSFIRKIMLTGEANSDLAVQAFNEGVINKFFKKSSEQAVVELNNAMLKAQFNYYAEQTEIFCDSLPKKYLPSFLRNQALINLLSDFIKNDQCCEFYFLNYEGDILLLDHSGNMQLLMVRGEKEMQASARQVNEIYLDEPMESLESMVNAFKKYELIAEPLPMTQKNANLSAWEKRVHPATKVTTPDSVIYYALTRFKAENMTDYLPKAFKIKPLAEFEGAFTVR
jgi:CheY-like chemotaxis protein